mmetsp:Transcript_86108/g.143298  ORF Transcript_86108/g.143298 Transcript_86108/m.143298 type:complete len:94 (+) Transcript_86108:23-304(+)
MIDWAKMANFGQQAEAFSLKEGYSSSEMTKSGFNTQNSEKVIPQVETMPPPCFTPRGCAEFSHRSLEVHAQRSRYCVSGKSIAQDTFPEAYLR